MPAGDHAAIVALPGGDGLTVSYTLEYDNPVLGQQHFTLRVEPDAFREEIAPARTFCLAAEAEALRAAGLGKGATYQNTLVVGDEGVIENTPHWPDEFARHKLLDLLGDLFLRRRRPARPRARLPHGPRREPAARAGPARPRASAPPAQAPARAGRR